MGPQYKVGQRVVIRPVKDQPLSARECNIEAYAGHIGKVSNFYWIDPRAGRILYIYTVRLGTEEKELVLHEDEIEACRT